MNNKTKGWIAAGLGGALLLGTGGTFAMWSAGDSVLGGSIRTGNLAVSVDGTMRNKTVLDGDMIAWQGGKLVPNGKVEGKAQVFATVDGPMDADLAVDSVNITTNLPGNLKDLVKVSAVLTDGNTTGTVLHLASSNEPQNFTLIVTVELGDATSTTLVNKAIDLGNVTVTLKQTATHA